MQKVRNRLILLYLVLICSPIYSLKCRSDDGPTDGELKRVARTCMRKISDNSYPKYGSNMGTGTNSGSNSNNYYGQQEQRNYAQNSNNRNKYGYDRHDNEEDEDNGDNANKYYNRDRNYERDNTQNIWNQRSHQVNQRDRSTTSKSNERGGNTGSNDAGRYDHFLNNAKNSNGNSMGGSGSGTGAGNNQRSSNSNKSNNNSNHNNNGNNNNNAYNTSSSDRERQSDNACVVHCFFEEMNMLNNDDYPDKHKVIYMLTKDMRDRELRAFYTETIQECYQTQRKRDKCHFSRELISCMTEYAKANCDDWEDYNIMFNRK